MRRFALALGALLASFLPAAAQNIVAVLSTREVAITSTYSGAEVTIFGAIERDSMSVARQGSYDVIVSVLGPAGNVTVREKERFGPVWINGSQRKFFEVPLYHALLSNRPLAEMTGDLARERLKLGLSRNLMAPPIETEAEFTEDLSYREALERLQRERGLNVTRENGVTMLRPNIFSAQIPLPGAAPLGLYVVNVSVLSDGVPLRTVQAGFVVRKIGVDAFVADAARSWPWLYGLATLAMAVLLGWLANTVFRRE